MTDNKKRAAVFILLGQSNAVGHGIPMEEKDKITVPMKNVFGLSRELNQSYDNEKLDWSGYLSAGMNLAEQQDDTYSVANCLAQLWQDEIDAGNPRNLPDLYIIQIAIGAQGVTEKYMWYPDREKKLVPGKLGTVDISLAPLTCHIFSLIKESFEELGKKPSFIGVHWIGGGEDTTVCVEELQPKLKGIYERLFEGFYDSLGEKIPIVLHYRVCKERAIECDPTGEYLRSFYFINEVFTKLAEENENISLFDISRSPFYEPDTRQHGLFIEDVVHHTPKTNRWIAAQIIDGYVN